MVTNFFYPCEHVTSLSQITCNNIAFIQGLLKKLELEDDLMVTFDFLILYFRSDL
jgi:hypothetical protein